MIYGTEHKFKILDLTSSKFDTTYVTFSDIEFNRGRDHCGHFFQVEWAVGTNYV